MITWDEVPEADDFGYHPEPGPDVQLKHFVVIEIEEVPGELSPLTRAVISSFAKEVKTLNNLLGRSGVRAVMERWTTAGRHRVDVVDQAEQLSKGLDRNHFLVTSPAKEPGDGSWTEQFDWHIEHPAECTPAIRYDGLCPFEEEINHSGRDAFGQPQDWDAPPFRKHIRNVVKIYPAGPWGGEEFDAYIEEVDEVDEVSEECE